MENENGLAKQTKQTELTQWAIDLSSSSLCPQHLRGKPKDILYIAEVAFELNIPRTTAINQIYVINDKTTLGVHLYKALAIRAGVTWKMLKSVEPVYSYRDSIKNSYNIDDIKTDALYKVFPFSAANRPKNFDTDIAPQYKDKILVFRSSLPSDYKTEIEFRRKINGIEMVHIETFLYSRAQSVGLADSKDATTGEFIQGSNPQWTKRPKNMCESRCFTEGIRNIAADAVNGMYHRDEILDDMKISYNLETEQEAVVLTNVIEETVSN